MRYSFAVSSIEELKTLLHDEDALVRLGSARELGRRGSAAVSAVGPLILRAIDDRAPLVRGAATFALVSLAKQRVPSVVPVVRESTESRQYAQRARAAWVLEHVECAATEANGRGGSP